MMRMLKKLLANSMLLAVLFGLLALPIGSIGLADLSSSSVLSEQDVRDNTVYPTYPVPVSPRPDYDYKGEIPTTPQTTESENVRYYSD